MVSQGGSGSMDLSKKWNKGLTRLNTILKPSAELSTPVEEGTGNNEQPLTPVITPPPNHRPSLQSDDSFFSISFEEASIGSTPTTPRSSVVSTSRRRRAGSASVESPATTVQSPPAALFGEKLTAPAQSKTSTITASGSLALASPVAELAEPLPIPEPIAHKPSTLDTTQEETPDEEMEEETAAAEKIARSILSRAQESQAKWSI